MAQIIDLDQYRAQKAVCALCRAVNMAFNIALCVGVVYLVFKWIK